MSLKEGSNKSLFESMFAGTPVLALRENSEHQSRIHQRADRQARQRARSCQALAAVPLGLESVSAAPMGDGRTSRRSRRRGSWRCLLQSLDRSTGAEGNCWSR